MTLDSCNYITLHVGFAKHFIKINILLIINLLPVIY